MKKFKDKKTGAVYIVNTKTVQEFFEKSEDYEVIETEKEESEIKPEETESEEIEEDSTETEEPKKKGKK